MKRLATVYCICLGLALAGSPAWAQTEQHDHGAKGPIKAGTVNF